MVIVPLFPYSTRGTSAGAGGDGGGGGGLVQDTDQVQTALFGKWWHTEVVRLHTWIPAASTSLIVVESSLRLNCCINNHD